MLPLAAVDMSASLHSYFTKHRPVKLDAKRCRSRENLYSEGKALSVTPQAQFKGHKPKIIAACAIHSDFGKPSPVRLDAKCCQSRLETTPLKVKGCQ